MRTQNLKYTLYMKWLNSIHNLFFFIYFNRDGGCHSLHQFGFLPPRIPFPRENLVIRICKKGAHNILHRIVFSSRQDAATLRINNKPQSPSKSLMLWISSKEFPFPASWPNGNSPFSRVVSMLSLEQSFWEKLLPEPLWISHKRAITSSTASPVGKRGMNTDE